MDKLSCIFIVGYNDIIEKSLYQYFKSNGYQNVYSSSAIGLNVSIQPSVYDFFQKHRPEYVFLGSTRSGGIQANIDSPGEFLYHNLESQNNIVYSAWKFGVKKLLYVGASCVYPKNCPQPMKEEYLLTGPLEETSEAYSLAKIAGVKLCQAYRKQYGFSAVSVIPATVYGPSSDADLEKAHVMGALIGKFTQAIKEDKKEVVVWGTGKPRREFLYADDFVDACLFLMDRYDQGDPVNIGAGKDIAIKELAELVGKAIGFRGKIVYDTTKPDGAAQKFLDSGRMGKLGWQAKISLEEGMRRVVNK